MIFNSNKNEQWDEYKGMLEKICALSNLFSDSKVPYLYYRVHENMFSKAFNAENLSREDCAFDAKFEDIGIGLKTFVNSNGKTYQKVAEFNKDILKFKNLTPKEKMIEISKLRNRRIIFAKENHSIEKCIYHCIAREEKSLFVFEEKMDLIDIDNLKLYESTEKSIKFTDNINDYNFNFGKSTLFKRFNTENYEIIPIHILEEPFNFLKKLNIFEELEYESVILPLYSPRDNNVQEKSDLNQWNVGGRKRDKNECYIPIPAVIHTYFPEFFPKRDRIFKLHLPNKKILSAKVCQDGGKALMSNPNSDLGKWLLRDLLHLEYGEPATLNYLHEIGIDSVEIRKLNNEEYSINFMPVGSYKKFYNEKMQKKQER